MAPSKKKNQGSEDEIVAPPLKVSKKTSKKASAAAASVPEADLENEFPPAAGATVPEAGDGASASAGFTEEEGDDKDFSVMDNTHISERPPHLLQRSQRQ